MVWKESLIMNDTKLEKAIFQGRHFLDTLISHGEKGKKLARLSVARQKERERKKWNESDDIKSNGDEINAECEARRQSATPSQMTRNENASFLRLFLRRLAGLCVKNQ